MSKEVIPKRPMTYSKLKIPGGYELMWIDKSNKRTVRPFIRESDIDAVINALRYMGYTMA